MATLDQLARQYGIALHLKTPDGQRTSVPDATKRSVLKALGVQPDRDDLPPVETASTFIPRCFLPHWLENSRTWGIAAQLYELRSARNWGIGDFADLAELCRIAAAAGADLVGLNPLHALFLGDPGRCSAFSPSNRLFLNPLYIAVDHVAGFRQTPEQRVEIARLQSLPLVDYEDVTALTLAALREIWRAEGGEPLRLHALFEALSFKLVNAGYGAGWTNWPPEFQDSQSDAVSAFATDPTDDVLFQLWLQWPAHRQLAAAADAAKQAGLRIGLFLDLAVGDAPDGSATWSDPELFAKGVSIGAPPDMFSEIGQDWALAPLSPTALLSRDLAPYRAMLAANMRYAGALRMDHVMVLRQLFWVPHGSPPAEGAHVRYPMEKMIAALADATQKHRTLLIGEDLGHVPHGFRDTMRQAAILAYRPLYFEQHGDAFVAAEDYPPLALACLSTHDLPTLTGCWEGQDIALREENRLITPEAAAIQAALRESERRALACRRADTLPAKVTADGPLPDVMAVATHLFVARTPSRLAVARLVDLVGCTQATNVPGTIDTYPNWRPKVPVAIEALQSLSLFQAVTNAMARERPRL